MLFTIFEHNGFTRNVATWLDDGGLFNDFFIANLLLSMMVMVMVTVKEF